LVQVEQTHPTPIRLNQLAQLLVMEMIQVFQDQTFQLLQQVAVDTEVWEELQHLLHLPVLNQVEMVVQAVDLDLAMEQEQEH
tara:strand:+ start:23 stop:268 length:246 start_codon:yes stop_codon:yes gene_type:complete